MERMLIQDIKPRGKLAAAEKVSTDTVKQIHQATNLKKLASQRPQFRQYKSFDILPAKPVKRYRPSNPAIRAKTVNRQKPVHAPRERLQDTPLASEQELARDALVVSLVSYAQYPLYVLLILLAAYNYSIGQGLILIYAISVLFIRIGAKYSIITVAVLIAGAFLANAVGYAKISENFAVYAYELFVIAILQTIISTWLENKTAKAA